MLISEEILDKWRNDILKSSSGIISEKMISDIKSRIDKSIEDYYWNKSEQKEFTGFGIKVDNNMVFKHTFENGEMTFDSKTQTLTVNMKLDYEPFLDALLNSLLISFDDETGKITLNEKKF